MKLCVVTLYHTLSKTDRDVLFSPHGPVLKVDATSPTISIEQAKE